jgi:hypothetical protein
MKETTDYANFVSEGARICRELFSGLSVEMSGRREQSSQVAGFLTRTNMQAG